MKSRKEQFECSHCGQKFNFKKNAEEHEDTCSNGNGSCESPEIDQDGKRENLVIAIWRVL
jgi:hypothetical protein